MIPKPHLIPTSWNLEVNRPGITDKTPDNENFEPLYPPIEFRPKTFHPFPKFIKLLNDNVPLIHPKRYDPPKVIKVLLKELHAGASLSYMHSTSRSG